MHRVLVLAAILTLAAVSLFYVENSAEPDQFEEWKRNFGHKFEAGEEPYRKIIFQKNLKKIKYHNTDSTQTYQMGINQFSIFTQEEFKHRFLSDMIIPTEIQPSEDLVEYPTAAVDWTTQGKVSRVKNQGNCGSCWAFSATGVAESWASFYGQFWDLSEQQLVDCTATYGNHGCDGGYPSKALMYIKDYGLSTEQQYPYVARVNTCAKRGGQFRINNVQYATGCNGLTIGITGRPLSITVDASNWAQYRSGVFNNCAVNINHCVLLVGTDSNGIWKIKNSWGTAWGEAGYIRLAPGNTCGICLYAGVFIE